MTQIFMTLLTSTVIKWRANGRIKCTSAVCPRYVNKTCWQPSLIKLHNSMTFIYRVGEKSKLLILSEYVNKTDKMGECEQIRTAAENMKHCLIFSREIFYISIVLSLNILWLKAINEITARQTRTSLHEHNVIRLCSIEYITTEIELVLPIFKSRNIHKIIEYLTLGLPSILWSTYHSTTPYFFDHPVYILHSQLTNHRLPQKTESSTRYCKQQSIVGVVFFTQTLPITDLWAMAPIMKVSIISILILYCNHAHFKNSLSFKPARKYTTQPNSVQWHTEIK